MTSTIDKKIVEMSFENSKFESGVDKSLSTIDKLKKSLNFDGSQKGFDKINESANRVNLSHISNSLEDVKNRFSIMGVVGFTVIQNLTNSAITLGKKLVEAFLGIDSIRAGFGSYETKINAIRTVMSGTGETIDQVTQSINDLNKYSDRTIFSFQDMTENISKFTNAGLSSKAAATAIQGISNVAAESGASAQEAARAMYNFGQALQQGSVRLMDWKSIENANMATIEFKEQLLNAAAAAGTLQKQADGTFKTINGGEVVTATRNFNNSLEKQWLTAEVLTNTLADYASETTEIGKKANAAATQVRTFSQLMSTLADSLKTGWTKSFEIVVGNLDEATSFFSVISNYLGDTAVAAAKSRNVLLQGWKDLGGRQKLLDAFANTLNTVTTIAYSMVGAFREFFPPITAQQLVNMSNALAKFTEKIKMAVEGSDKIRRIFRGVFAVFDIVRMAVVALAKALFGLAGSYSGAATSFTELIAKFADWLVKLRDSIAQSKTFTTVFETVAKVVKKVIDGVTLFFGALIGGFKSTDKVTKSKSISNFLDGLAEKFKSFGKLGTIIGKIFDILSKLAAKLGPIIGKIGSVLGNVFEKVLDGIAKALDNIDVNKVLDVLNKGLLGGVLISLKGFVDSSKSVIGGGLFASILLSIKEFIDNGGSMFKGVSGILDSVKGSLDAYQKQLKAGTLLKIAGAIALLAASIIALAFVDPKRLLTATSAIGAMFVGLATTLDIFEKTTSGGQKILVLTASMIGISAAMLIMAGAVAILSKLDPKAAAQGVLAVGAVLGLILVFQKFTSGKAIDLGIMAISIVGLASAMVGLGKALKSLGDMDTETLAKGLAAMAVSLGIISVGLNSMTATLSGSASLLVAAGAIGVLTLAFMALGNLSLEQVGIGLLAIAGAFTVIGVAGALMTPIAPTLAIIAASMLAMGLAAAAFGVGVAAVGMGLASLAVGITTLAGLSSVGIATVVLVVTGLAALIPVIVTQIVKGLVTLLEEIAKAGPRIAVALAGIGVAMINAFATISPQLVGAILKLVKDLLVELRNNIPTIVAAGGDLLYGFLEGILRNIGRVTEVSADIITAYLEAIATKLPQIIQAGWDLIISFIDGLADAAEKNIPRLYKSVEHLGESIVSGVVRGIIAASANLFQNMAQLAWGAIQAFQDALQMHSPSKAFEDASKFIPIGAANGIKKYADIAYTAVADMGTGVVSRFSSVISKISDGLDTNMDFNPTITPVVDLSNVSKSSSQIDNLLANKQLNLSVATVKAGAISATLKENQTTPQPVPTTAQPEPKVVSFTQINNSPKELSAIDIYRQTRNQLLKAKGLVGG